MKKILSLTLVLVLVLSSFTMAFAGAAPSEKFSDVDDSAVGEAVDRLSAFGIVDGYEDGSYQPEGMVKRAEFAKLLVTALGLENAAGAAAGASEFTDVMGTEWYAGFVNVAAGQGIVAGYPDGTFQPNDQVTYGEAVTMLVRALGYKDSFLPGQWPSNYIAKGASLNITDDVTFFAQGFANRGDAAVLVNNTLDAKIVVQKTFGAVDEWEESDLTLLEDKLQIDKFEEVQIVSVPRVDSRIDEDQIKIESDDKNGTYDVADEYILMKASNLLGISVNVYMDEDDVVYVEESDDNYSVDFGSINLADSDFDADELNLVYTDGNDDDYDLDENVIVYIDNEKMDLEDVNADMFGRVVTDNKGNVTLLDLNEWDIKAGIVTDLEDYGFEYIEGNDDIDNATEFDADDFDKVVYRDVDGNLLELDDVDVNDVVYISNEQIDGDALEELASGDEVAYVYVVKSFTVEEADRWSSSEFKTSEDTYDVDEYFATVTDNEKEDVHFYDTNDAKDILNTLTGDEADVTILFDIVNEVRHIDSDVETSSTDKYGIVTNIDWDRGRDGVASGVNDLDLVIEDGSEVTYDLDFEAIEFVGYDVEAGDGTADDVGFELGQIIKFNLNSDGEINSAVLAAIYDIEFVAQDGNTDSDDFTVVSIDALSDDFGDDQVEINGDYIVSSNVKVLDVYDIYPDFEDAEVVDYETLIDTGFGGEVLFAVDENGEIVFLALVGDIASTDEYSAYVESVFTKDEDVELDLVLPGGDKETYLASDGDADASSVKAGDVIVYTLTGNEIDVDAINTGSTIDFDLFDESSIVKDGSYLIIGTDSYRTDGDTIYYDYDDDPIDLRDLEDGDSAYIAVEGRYVKVVSRYTEADGSGGSAVTDYSMTYTTGTAIDVEIPTSEAGNTHKVKITNMDNSTIPTSTVSVVGGEAEFSNLVDGTYYKAELFLQSTPSTIIETIYLTGDL